MTDYLMLFFMMRVPRLAGLDTRHEFYRTVSHIGMRNYFHLRDMVPQPRFGAAKVCDHASGSHVNGRVSNPPQNWAIVGSATGGYQDVLLQAAKGTGVLYNQFSEKIQFKSEANLLTKDEHGDIFLATDFMLPK